MRASINLYNGDCMKAMAKMRDNEFDLAIVDPPYGIGADNKNSGKKLKSRKSSALLKDYGEQRWDSNIPDISYFNELVRISKHQIIWGVNYYPYSFLIGGRIYWNKCVTMPTYSDGELAYCSKINSLKSFKFAWHGMIQGNMKEKEHRIHPTQKPVQLYKWLLQNYAKEGDKILDTHGGSMSIAIACWDLGFDLDLYEIDKEYFEAGKLRLKRHKSQGQLF